MKQQIHINDQGELLLIEAPDKESYRYAGIADEATVEKHYQFALSEAIEKGIKFREQRWIITLINRELNRLASDDLPKGQSFDLLTGYTVEVEHQCRVDETHEFERCAFGDCNRKGEGNKRKVAVLTPLKQSGEPGNEAKKGSSKRDTLFMKQKTITEMLGELNPKPGWCVSCEQDKVIHEICFECITKLIRENQAPPSSPTATAEEVTLKWAKYQIAKKYGYETWTAVSFYAIDAMAETTKPPYAEEALNDEVAEFYASLKEQEAHNRAVQECINLLDSDDRGLTQAAFLLTALLKK